MKIIHLSTWKYGIFALPVILLQVSCWGQPKVTEKRALKPFNAIVVSDGIRVYLEKGSKQRVLLEITQGDPSDVLTEVSGGNLKISLEDNFKNILKKIKVKAHVTYVELNSIKGSSASHITLSNVLVAPKVSLGVSSAASIEASLKADKTVVQASSAGKLTLAGETAIIRIKASSAANVEADRLNSNRADVGASSGSRVTIAVKRALEATASSGASVRYWGAPDKVYVKSSSGGSIKKKQ